MSIRSRILRCVLAAGILAPTASVSAQGLSVTVVDATGATIAEATVTLSSASGGGRSLRTGADGHARFEQVPLGPALVRVERLGFRPREVQTRIDEGGATVEVRLDVAVDEVVQVEGIAPSYRPILGSTATKLPNVPSRDIPFTVDAVPARVLADQHVSTINEALKNVSGIGQQVGWGGMGSRYTIRGFSVPAQLKNGFRQNIFTPLVDMANVEQVEVLKGPSSALFGSFEPGGIVSVVTKRPLSQAARVVEFSAGSFSTYRPTIDFTGPLNGARTLLYRLNAAYTSAESYRDFYTSESLFVSPVLEWRPSDRTNLLVEIEHFDRSGGFDRGFGNNPLVLAFPRERNLGEPTDRADGRTTAARYVFTRRLTDRWTLRHGTMVSRGETDVSYFNFATPLFAGSLYGRRATHSVDHQDDYNVQTELFGTARTGRAEHRVLMGVEFGDDDWTFDIQRGPVSRIDPFQPTYGAQPGVLTPQTLGRFGNQTVAAYAQDLVALGRWKLIAGARLASVRSRGDVDFDLLGVPFDVKRTHTSVSPRAGVTFQPTAEVSVYASAARSFRAVVDARVDGGGLPDPTLGTQVEGGLKTEWFGGQVSTTASVFRLVKERALVGNPNDPFGLSFQTGEQTIDGVELSAALAPMPGWNAIASFASMDAAITRDTTIPVGTRLVNVPGRTFSLWTAYQVPSGEMTGLGGGIGVFYVGERAANPLDTFGLPAYTRWDAAAFYDRARWRLALNVFNLSDALYWESGGGFVTAYPAAPRSITGSLGVRF